MPSTMAMISAPIDVSTLPELDDLIYRTEVLQLPSDQREHDAEHDLHTRAEALGIVVARPPSPVDKRYTSSAQSASTAVTYHGRTFSSGSDVSASTALTDSSSKFATASPDLKYSEDGSRRRTRALAFTQYDRYLSKLSPNLDQPKLRKPAKAVDASSKSLFSVKTGKSFFGIKSSSFRTKMRLRRQSRQPFELAIGEEELERRRIEEERQRALVEAEAAAKEEAETLEATEKLEAQERSKAHSAIRALETSQLEEHQRFDAFSRQLKEQTLQRHSTLKSSLEAKHADQEEKMKERHTKTAGHLEDRQIAAEMELRSTLEASERSVRIRLKHMEAYCDGLGRTDGTSKMPARTVTERDLRELGQQYTLRDGMERLHQSKINVMRDRQAKRMEELLERHEAEVEKLEEQKREDLEDLAARFAHEHDAINEVLKQRQSKLKSRWELSMEVLCKELETQDQLSYAVLPRPHWPDEVPEDGTQEHTGKQDIEEDAVVA
ncbi:hypothetical protein LIA77_10336 [Sarocladium implicatum]|nr:hypothetical protein LIA77_10336 [Sarocladium implicatum]